MENINYDVMILGAGPAGLQAAIHAARRKVSVLVLGRLYKSSAHRAHIENFCCIGGITGEELLREGKDQAEHSGARFLDEDVMSLSREEPYFSAKMESGRILKSLSLILAMGVARNKLNVKGEKEFVGRGVSYCVDCDAGFYKGQSVAVVGCESAAVAGALTLLFYAREVHLICERLDVAQPLDVRLRESPIVLHEGKRPRDIEGRTDVEAIILDDGTRLDVSGVFIELGAKGAVELAAGLGVSLDAETMQYIVTDKSQATTVPGVYAAGDICGPPWQVAKAVGEGCVAGLEAAKYAKARKAGKVSASPTGDQI